MERSSAQKSPLMRLWEWGGAHHAGLIRAILCAVVGVLGGIAPFAAAARIMVGLIQNERELSYYLIWCGVALGGYISLKGAEG